MGRSGLVQTLEKAGAEGSPIDEVVVQPKATQRCPVQHAAPFAVAPAVELVRVFETQECLGLAVAGLLAKVGARVLAAVVPHTSAGRKGNPVASLLQPPAYVYVIA